MVRGELTNKKLTSPSDEDEMPIELRIVCSVKPGDASNSPTCRITNVAVSQTHDEDLDHDQEFDEEHGDSESKIAEIHKLRRKENKGDSNRSGKKKHVDEESDDEEDEDGGDDWDTESLDEDEDDEDQDTVLSCVQRSMVKQGSTSLKKKR